MTSSGVPVGDTTLLQRLKEMDEKAMDRPWMTPEETGDPYDVRCPVDHEGCNVWPWGSEENMRLAYTLRNALPAVVTLIEAAQRHLVDGVVDSEAGLFVRPEASVDLLRAALAPFVSGATQ